MRSTEFIVEGVNIGAIEQIAANIKRDCQPFLKSIRWPNNTKWLYRGMNIRAGQPAEAYLEPFPIRTDRRPLHTAAGASKVVDDWLYAKVGWYPRSQGLFATGSIRAASDFGNVHAIFPTGPFNSIWSESISDMTYAVSCAIGTVAKSEEEDRDYAALTPKLIKMLEAGKWHKNDSIATYLDTASKNEIVISAASFYALPLAVANKQIPLDLVKEYLK